MTNQISKYVENMYLLLVDIHHSFRKLDGLHIFLLIIRIHLLNLRKLDMHLKLYMTMKLDS
jgi:hypothetical protein